MIVPMTWDMQLKLENYKPTSTKIFLSSYTTKTELDISKRNNLELRAPMYFKTYHLI